MPRSRVMLSIVTPELLHRIGSCCEREMDTGRTKIFPASYKNCGTAVDDPTPSVLFVQQTAAENCLTSAVSRIWGSKPRY